MLIGCQEVKDSNGNSYVTFSVEGTDEEIKRFYNKEEVEMSINKEEENDFYAPENEEDYKNFLEAAIDDIDIDLTDLGLDWTKDI